MKLRRTVATYEACSPNAVASGSKAQMMYFVEDAQKDIGTLADMVQDLSTALRTLLNLNDDHTPFGGEMYQDRVDRAWDTARATVARVEAGAS